jgi:hypothetical protein
MGICEKHQLPLDRTGECELCRLSDMPSNPPPVRSAWWVVIIPFVLAVTGIAWAMSSFNSAPEERPPRGVRTATPSRPNPPPAAERPNAPEPEAMPTRPPPPVPGDVIPVPEPDLDGEPPHEPPAEETPEPTGVDGGG